MGVAGGAHLESCANALQCLCDHGKMGAKLPETAYLEFSQRGVNSPGQAGAVNKGVNTV
jgi:hypothetical protein